MPLQNLLGKKPVINKSINPRPFYLKAEEFIALLDTDLFPLSHREKDPNKSPYIFLYNLKYIISLLHIYTSINLNL